MLALLLMVLLSAGPALAASSYVPQKSTCPSETLVRAASGLSDEEDTYRVARKAVADISLKSWLISTNSGFGTSGELPTVAITTSGGGYRSLLSGAGVIQALDSRDSNLSTSGLYQAMTYQAGLSGGGWLLSSLAGNNYPLVSYLLENVWHEAFRDSLLDLDFLLAFVAYAEVVNDIAEKEAAGYDTTFVDAYGRLLSYQLLEGSDGGAATTMSGVSSKSMFTSYSVPYPVITSLGTKVWDGECTPGPNATTYEIHPYEFGSWDADVSAFIKTEYLGTSMSGGKATGLCTTNYDNLGYIAGSSSNLFNEACLSVPAAENSSTSLSEDISAILDQIHEVTTSDLYATYPNPFYNFISSTGFSNIVNNISAQDHLSLVDGGEALQNNPIFPFLQPARNISVILVNDNSADLSTNFPNGSEILTTYVQATNNAHLTRMPYIPSVDTFISEGLNTRATFFGCNATDKITIVYLPNVNYTFDSGVSTSQLVYSETEQDEMVANGNMIATQGNKDGWATCLGCAIMMKSGNNLPTACTACFEEYCYYE
ncbi:lysophospholipase [Acephala macrosclerotiorum]|nr:lysophospholipase [Acephala macrosclerotiorum]